MERRDACAATAIEVHLLDGFVVVSDGRPVELSTGESRLVAFLALHGGMRRRLFVAGNLWPEVDENRARGNLRSALWRLRGAVPGIVADCGDQVALSSRVRADTTQLSCVAKQLLDGELDDVLPDRSALCLELLPGWYDDWVLYERERLRQLCLHALERLAERLLEEGRFGAALDVALTAVRGEPLRETAHRMAVRIHLAEGNLVEAVRQYDQYACLIRAELGVRPSEGFSQLVSRLARRPLTGAGDPQRGPRATV